MRGKIWNDSLRRRMRRAASIRARVEGSSERPRLSVFRSANHIYAQLVDDIGGKTLVAVSTVTKDLRAKVKDLKKAEQAEQVGKALAEAAKGKGIEAVVFDRKGWTYHGRIAALAKGARDGGLKF